MNIITLDFETYFDNDYTLSKLTTEEYVRDPRFEAHGCAVRWEDGHTKWYVPDEMHLLQGELEMIQSDTAVLCHHAHFDGLILAHHYGIVPKLYLDTLSMARALVGTHIGKSLQSLAEHFGLGAKNVPYDLFKGKHWHELSPTVRDQVAQGAVHDVQLAWDLFHKLAASFPAEEYALVDATVRMFTAPVLVGDTDLLGKIWQEEEAKKGAMLAQLGLTAQDIRKDWQFAKLLRDHGVEPEQKRMKDMVCKTCTMGKGQAPPPCTECNDTGFVERFKYAFAKTDDFMRDLQDSEDVRLLAETKLAAHSTGTQTRTYRLGWMSTRGAMPVYLNYCGSHTKRWSGGDKVNWQNLARNGPIGAAISAPPGHKVVALDASQIECRLLNGVAGQEDKIQEFREGKDPYVGNATAFYGYEVNKTDHPTERQGGKVVELQSGFGSGGAAIARTLRRLGIPCTEEEGEGWKNAYRGTHSFVTSLWKEAGDVLKKLHSGMEFEWRAGLYVKDKRIWLPNDLPLIYETLKWEDDPEDGGDAGWRVRVNKNGWSRMYGAKLVENVIQALARVHVSQAWVRCAQAGLDMVSMEHDKLIAVVNKVDADAAFELMKAEMCRPPAWLPDLPLDSEGYISDTFAKQEA